MKSKLVLVTVLQMLYVNLVSCEVTLRTAQKESYNDNSSHPNNTNNAQIVASLISQLRNIFNLPPSNICKYFIYSYIFTSF